MGAATSLLFAPLSPLAVIVESDLPEFRWQALPGATSYRVEIYDSEFHLVMRSLEQRETIWTPPQPLERARLYRWQIVAVYKGNSITSPAPPAPDAEFRILDAQAEERVAHAPHRSPMGHLLAAILLGQAGLKTEASAELAMLPPETRRLPEIEKLIFSVPDSKTSK